MNTLKQSVSRLSLIVILAATVSGIRADVPRLIHYQGKLRDADGAAVSATVNLRLRLYDAPSGLGTPLFDETHAGVVVADGLFSVLIGSNTPPSPPLAGGVPDSALDATDVYLGVAINGGTELSPRSRIAASSHALLSRSAEQLVRPNTFQPAVSVDAAGNVGIGTTAAHASAILDLTSNGRGFLPPRMTTVERNQIGAPANGLIILNTTTGCLEFYLGGMWQSIGCGCLGPPAMPDAIAGATNVCPSQNGVVYSVTNVAGVTYAWSYSGTGFTCASGCATNAITANFSAGATSGTLSCTPSNTRGNGTAQTYPITVDVCSGSQTFNANGAESYTGSVQNFTIPTGVPSVTIQAYGAEGGPGGGPYNGAGGMGAYMVGTFSGLTPGAVLNVLVGKQGAFSNYTGGGGGGSFVWNSSNALLIAAAGGGGGGAAHQGNTPGGPGSITTTPTGGGGGPGSAPGGSGGNGGAGGSAAGDQSGGGGGAGWSTNGGTGGSGTNPELTPGGGGSYPLGAGTGEGGTRGGGATGGGRGGYGGGGGSSNGDGGGGGGYNGGGGGDGFNSTWAGGGGGGSYILETATNTSGSTSGYQSGNGQVIISW